MDTPTSTTVAVILDPGFGSKTIPVASEMPVWVVRSAKNDTAASTAWALGLSVTTFEPAEPGNPEGSLLAILPDVDLHHGPDSQRTPYRAVTVVGVSISSALRAALQELGFVNARRTRSGFAVEALAAVQSRYLSEESAGAAADEFMPFVRAYIGWLERAAEHSVDNAQMLELYVTLAELQAAAARLPSNIGGDEIAEDDDPDHSRAVSEAKVSWDLARRVIANFPEKAFEELAEPDRKEMLAMLGDDLSDIHSDLMDGLRKLDAGAAGDAVWEWWFGYWHHWGKHAVDAQQRLWAYLGAGNYFD